MIFTGDLKGAGLRRQHPHIHGSAPATPGYRQCFSNLTSTPALSADELGAAYARQHGPVITIGKCVRRPATTADIEGDLARGRLDIVLIDSFNPIANSFFDVFTGALISSNRPTR